MTHGSLVPTDIIGPIVVATSCSTVVTVILDRILRKFS
jgi:spore maturation protein SpmA